MARTVINQSSRLQARRTVYRGRDYIVAPLALIVPGVLNGSKGALYYPPDEVSKNPEIWNHTPIVVYHPFQNGKPVSAKTPGVLEQSGVGEIRNATISGGKLVAEGWFDVERLRAVDHRVLTSLQKNQQIELSTGLFTENEAASGVDEKGRQYSFIARNYKPDHLAILPDQIGACSLKDGCGVLMNQRRKVRNARSAADKNGADSEGGEGGEARNEWPELGTFKPSGPYGGRGKKAYLKAKKEMKGSPTSATAEKASETALNKPAKSAAEEGRALHKTAADAHKAAAAEHLKAKRLYAAEYHLEKANSHLAHATPTSLYGEPNHFKSKPRWTRADLIQNQRSHVGSTTFNREPIMAKLNDRKRKLMIDDLINNCDCGWTEDDRELLGNLGDATLQGMHRRFQEAREAEAVVNTAREVFEMGDLELNAMPAAIKKKIKKMRCEEDDDDEDEPTKNQRRQKPQKPQTVEDWMRSAPAEIRSAVQNAMRIEAEEKRQIIERLTANVEDDDDRERIENRLQNKPLDELRDLAALQPVKQEKEPHYAGLAPTRNTRFTDNDRQAVLPIPVLDFKEIAKQN